MAQTNQPTPEEVAKFEKAYADLCKEHGLALTIQPQWKQSQDTGTYSLVIVPMIARVPDEIK